jgi:hypothetical protein
MAQVNLIRGWRTSTSPTKSPTVRQMPISTIRAHFIVDAWSLELETDSFGCRRGVGELKGNELS